MTQSNQNNDSVILTAQYRKQEISDFENNPLIEALPAILSAEQWFDRLENPAAFSQSERKMEPNLRSYLIARLLRFYQPLPRHLDLALRFDQMLRQGYVGRSPTNGDRVRILQKLYESEQQGGLESTGYSEYRPILSTSLIGGSGMGKSTTVERILGRYPRVIYHPEHALHQIVWMKIDCPRDGSVAQLGMNIIIEIDRLMGTNFQKHLPSRASADRLLGEAKHLLATYSLGFLVIDEIQNLVAKQSGGRESMLNYFQEMCNEFHVPVLIMGTMKATRILQYDFRHARRNAAVGSFAWEPMKKDESWLFLLESLWEYQWLQKPVPLTPELIDLIYKETQGVVGILTAMFMMAQLRALRTGKETMTKDLIKRVMQKDLAPVQPMLRALRSGDPRRISKYEDIEPLDIEAMIAREQQSILANNLKKTSRKKAAVSSAEQEAMLALTMMGYEEDQVSVVLERGLLEGITGKRALVRFVMDELSETENLAEDAQDKNGIDLRQYVCKDSVNSLQNDGIIKGTL